MFVVCSCLFALDFDVVRCCVTICSVFWLAFLIFLKINLFAKRCSMFGNMYLFESLKCSSCRNVRLVVGFGCSLVNAGWGRLLRVRLSRFFFRSSSAPERAPLLFFPFFLPSILLSLAAYESQVTITQSRYKIDSLIPILEHELNTSSPFNPIHITYFLTCIHMKFVKSLHTQANHYLNTHIKCLKKSTIRT